MCATRAYGEIHRLLATFQLGLARHKTEPPYISRYYIRDKDYILKYCLLYGTLLRVIYNRDRRNASINNGYLFPCNPRSYSLIAGLTISGYLAICMYRREY